MRLSMCYIKLKFLWLFAWLCIHLSNSACMNIEGGGVILHVNGSREENMSCALQFWQWMWLCFDWVSVVPQVQALLRFLQLSHPHRFLNLTADELLDGMCVFELPAIYIPTEFLFVILHPFFLPFASIPLSHLLCIYLLSLICHFSFCLSHHDPHAFHRVQEQWQLLAFGRHFIWCSFHAFYVCHKYLDSILSIHG